MKNFNTLKSTFQDSIFTWDYFTENLGCINSKIMIEARKKKLQ